MAEWLKALAWKAAGWSDVKAYQGTFSAVFSTTYRPNDVYRCCPV